MVTPTLFYQKGGFKPHDLSSVGMPMNSHDSLRFKIKPEEYDRLG